jgi:hypothetical protein
LSRVCVAYENEGCRATDYVGRFRKRAARRACRNIHTEILPDDTQATASALMTKAIAAFAALGIRLRNCREVVVTCLCANSAAPLGGRVVVSDAALLPRTPAWSLP